MEYVGDFIAHCEAGGEALIRLKNRFYVGDVLEALTPDGTHSFAVTARKLEETGESVQTASVAGMLIRVPVPFSVDEGDLLRGPNRNHR